MSNKRTNMSCLGFLGVVTALFGGVIGIFAGIWVLLAEPWNDQKNLTETPAAYVTSIDTRYSGVRGSDGYALRLAFIHEGWVYVGATNGVSEKFDPWSPGDPAPDPLCIDPDHPEQFTVIDDEGENCGEGDYGGGTSEAERFVPEGTKELSMNVARTKPAPPREAESGGPGLEGQELTFSYRHADPHDQDQPQVYRASSVWLAVSDWRPGDPLSACIDPDEPAVYVLITGEVTSCADSEVAQRGAAAVATAQRYPDDSL